MMIPSGGGTRRTFLKAAVATTGLVAIDNCFADAQSPDDLTCISATKLATKIAKREVSCVDVVTAYLARIEKINPKINAIVQLRAEEALKEAKQADKDLGQGRKRGPLHGVPFTLKDNLATAGIVTTAGMAELAKYVPKDDATVAKRLKAAGGILLGKTNVPEFCMFADTYNLVYTKRTRNPHDLSRVPGGSSGGEAAIIAACGSAFGVGTDIGGSIRTPSHFCGIAGLKPTTGRVPDTGMIDCFPPANARWNGIGPMARFVEDLALVLQVISGPDGHDANAADMPLRRKSPRLRKLRIAYYVSNGNAPANEEVEKLVRACALTLKELGADVVEDRPPGLEETPEVWWFNMNPDLGTTFRRRMKQFAEMAGTEVVEKRLPFSELFLKWQDVLVDQGHYSKSKRFKAGLQMQRYRSRMVAFLEKYDVILCPVANEPAKPITDDFSQLPPLKDIFDLVVRPGGSCTQAFNITGWPAASVPVAQTAEGLPLGVQVVAKPWREDVVLGVGAILEKHVGGWKPPKGI